MSDEPDFATFEKAPLEAYKTLFEKFLKAKGDNEKVCGRYLELSDELEETKDKLEALHAIVGDNSVLNDSNPEAEISILNDNMAAQGAQSSVSKAPVFCGNSESKSVFLWVTRLKKLQSVNKWTDQQTLDAATMALKGPAGEWWSYLQRRDPTSIDSLQNFLKEFQIQFEETASAVESVKCISNLAQRANEPGKDFFFRVGNSTYLSWKLFRLMPL